LPPVQCLIQPPYRIKACKLGISRPPSSQKNQRSGRYLSHRFVDRQAADHIAVSHVWLGANRTHPTFDTTAGFAGIIQQLHHAETSIFFTARLKFFTWLSRY